MSYVDKKVALQYLANSEKLFDKIRLSFLNSYKNAVEEINEMISQDNREDLYRYIHSIKGISLNLGSMILYEDSCNVLEKIKKEDTSLPSLEQFIYTLRSVYDELERL
ncbi:MAG: hypothetical protein E7176_02045 [Erysipelotrichaceae bacterium]|nr:hypothetical protein [Erysipelotrichaceae bacterium]